MAIRRFALILGSFSYMALTVQTAFADDTEIYVSRKLSEDQQIRPNLLFVIDNSGSMQTSVPGTTCNPGDRTIRNRCEAVLVSRQCISYDRRGRCESYQNNYEYRKTRLQVVKDVTNSLVEELRLSDDVNIGLMHFDAAPDTSNEQGGMVAIPVGRASTTASDFTTELNRLYGASNTPISESYYEAALYMKGATPKFGNDTNAAYENGGGWTNPTKSSVTASKSGSAYKSPIEYSCQKSNIILLTDGEPTYDNAANNDIRALITASGASNTQHLGGTCRDPGDSVTSRSGECMPHLAEHLANQDASSSQPGKQTVSTYTIGFATNQTLLQSTANAGNGRYFTTDNTSGLVSALKSILVEILAENTTFASPSVAVSAYNNLGYRNDLYYALFRPAEGARWVGNVKRYKAETITDSSGNSITQVVDKNGQPAIDESTGFFRESASSYWSTLDGRDVENGGVAGLLNSPNTRNILTWTSADRSPTASGGVAGSATLTHQLAVEEASVSQALLGVSTSEARTKAIQWGRGQDPDDPNAAARLQLADVLHNEPRLVAYTTDEDLQRVEDARQGTVASPEQLYMFFGTNEGFIHAVDPKTGAEKFAFIPKELLPNLNAYYQDPKGSDQKRYGVDGQFNFWIEYGPLDETTKTRSISKSYLYAGMRRGGRNYYSLDVTNISQPALKWVIKGGQTPGFEKLGQTWSTPRLANIKLNGANTKVLIFTGGYDPQQDIDSPNSPLAKDTQGNALYIVNADTGQLIWRAGHDSEAGANLKLASMTHSMPADPMIIDANGDGLADVIYAIDTRAQVFRFDIDNANVSASNLASGGRIASLGGSTALDNRRFFSMPDVAMVRERGGKSYYAIAVGSGYRAHPLNEDTIDRFYLLRDGPLFGKPASYTTLTESDLVDVSSVDLSDEQATTIQSDIAEAEAAINELHEAVALARDAFNTYRDGIGFSTAYNDMLQANSRANDLQADIDALLAAYPYLASHAAESTAQSTLQQGLQANQETLAALEKEVNEAYAELSARQAEHDANPTAENFEAMERARDTWQTLNTNQSTVTDVYSELIAIQAQLSSEYELVNQHEQELQDAIAANANDETINTLRDQLKATNDAYADHARYVTRSVLNSPAGETSALVNALASVERAIASGDLSELTTSVTDLQSLVGQGAESMTIEELLSRDESSKATQLSQQAENLNGNLKLVGDWEQQRLEQASLAATAQAEADALAERTYDESTGVLNDQQLQAARARYGNDLTQFEAYQFLLDEAQSAVANNESGVPALRQKINELYGQLVPGNSYTPNQTLLANSSGWFMRLPKGEKVLSTPLIFRGALFFSTFSPRGETITTCGPDVGRGRAYALNLRDASAILSVNDVATRSYALVRSGIPPSPTVLFSEDGPPRVIIGTEVLNDQPEGKGDDDDDKECIGDVGFCDKDKSPISKTYWREN